MNCLVGWQSPLWIIAMSTSDKEKEQFSIAYVKSSRSNMHQQTLQSLQTSDTTLSDTSWMSRFSTSVPVTKLLAFLRFFDDITNCYALAGMSLVLINTEWLGSTAVSCKLCLLFICCSGLNNIFIVNSTIRIVVCLSFIILTVNMLLQQKCKWSSFSINVV